MAWSSKASRWWWNDERRRTNRNEVKWSGVGLWSCMLNVSSGEEYTLSVKLEWGEEKSWLIALLKFGDYKADDFGQFRISLSLRDIGWIIYNRLTAWHNCHGQVRTQTLGSGFSRPRGESLKFCNSYRFLIRLAMENKFKPFSRSSFAFTQKCHTHNPQSGSWTDNGISGKGNSACAPSSSSRASNIFA